ncbi:MAG: hypothetical protein BM485_07490 [Desulfobulbaceae bacterium DB1]|nr:MAG: hypothetical protein BM485_07490 [Desulfobulbaceae bacterium DB1]
MEAGQLPPAFFPHLSLQPNSLLPIDFPVFPRLTLFFGMPLALKPCVADLNNLPSQQESPAKCNTVSRTITTPAGFINADMTEGQVGLHSSPGEF